MTYWSIIEGDCREALATIEPESVHTCVTSPPYLGLRDYGHDGQIGLETLDDYVSALVDVFRGVRGALRPDGTAWLNLGDTYAAQTGVRTKGNGGPALVGTAQQGRAAVHRPRRPPLGLKPKDLIGVPWHVAFALQADGWYLRSDIIWHKSNPMPESVADRPTRSHEYLFLLAKSSRYYYDAAAIKEESADTGRGSGREGRQEDPRARPPGSSARTLARADYTTLGRNKRSVWKVSTHPYRGAHFATFPPKLITPCILAGAPDGGLVLDPFSGAGTTVMEALRNGRSGVGIELNPDYAALSRERIRGDAPLLNPTAEAA